MKLRKSVKRAMKVLNIDKLRRDQLKPINTILDGQDTMVIAPTSFGKSILYQIPAIAQNDGITVVIEPLLALMHDQVQKLKKCNISADYLDSTQSDEERDMIRHAIKKGHIQILYLASERLETNILTWIEKTNQINLLVVDECHCVTTWGNTFRTSYLSIGEYVDTLEHRPTVVALSATAIPEDRPQIMELLSMQDVQIFEMSLYRSNLSFLKKETPSRRQQLHALKKYLKKFHPHTTIIFCNTKIAVEQVAKELKKSYPEDVMVYHSKEKRQEQDMLSGKKHIIVATSALSMGVDVPNVDLVIHFNMPLSMADYYQMAGRGGREGQHSRSILLYNPDDYASNYALLKKIEDKTVKKQAINHLDAMKEFCEDDEHCMVTELLHALGDSHEKSCRYCTNCQKER